MITKLQQLPMRHRWLRWAVLALCLGFSAASTYNLSTQVQQEGSSKFETVAGGISNDVQSRIRAYGDVTFALRGLFDASEKVTRDDFHHFAQALSLGERYPGVTNISFVARVPHASKLEFERAVRAETSPLLKGLPEFAIKPPGERPEYAVLTYIEPMGKNVAAWGLDLNADPLRRSVVERARDTGQMASSSGVTLLRDGNSSVTSTLLRLALYRGGGVPGSVEERRRQYRGMVGSTVRVNEMIDATLSKEVLSRAQLQIYEVGSAPGAGAAEGTLLFDSAASGTAGSAVAPVEFSRYAVIHRLAVGDREWRLRIVPREDPVDLLEKTAVAAMLAAMLAASVLLFWLMTSVAISESRGAELANTNEALHVENAERRRTVEALHRSETKFRTLYDSSSDAAMLLDQKGFFDCNPATLPIFGCATREEFCSKHPADLSPPTQPDGTDSLTLANQRVATAMGKGSVHFEWVHKRADTGETFPADVLLTAMTLGDKPVVQAVVRDITERKRDEAELQRVHAELEQRMADTATANNSLQRQTDELRRLNTERAALANMNELLTACASPEEAYEIFGRGAAGLFPSLSGALHIFAASRNQLTPAATWGAWPDAAMPASPESCWGLRRGKCYVGNGTSTPPCGHAGPARELTTLCVPLMAYGEVLGVLHLRGSDATAVQSTLQLATMAGDGLALNVANLRLRESLKAQSIRDPLTDLFNRRYLTETLEREFARAKRSGTPMAVIMIDADHFKRFNNSFGHDAGDAVLRELGAFFRQSIRAEDIACRYGGEEFCLVLPQMDRDGARARAELIRAGAARLEIRAGGRTLDPVTLSLGVALYPENGANAESLLRAADAALYLAKREGRNRVMMGAAPAAAEKATSGGDETHEHVQQG